MGVPHPRQAKLGSEIYSAHVLRIMQNSTSLQSTSCLKRNLTAVDLKKSVATFRNCSCAIVSIHVGPCCTVLRLPRTGRNQCKMLLLLALKHQSQYPPFLQRTFPQHSHSQVPTACKNCSKNVKRKTVFSVNCCKRVRPRVRCLKSSCNKSERNAAKPRKQQRTQSCELRKLVLTQSEV